nr:orotidine-5'-phosphate decarboxylase [Acidipila sp. EB88]
MDHLQQDLPVDVRLRWVKVGLELFLAEGAPLLSRLRAQGYQVFLDLKLHDIPNTVAGAIRSVLPSGPALLTVHACGGPAMLAAAARAAAGSATRLLAVTVLTSMDAAQLAATGVAASPSDQVSLLAGMAAAQGISGFVCSPRESEQLRQLLPTAHLVTPGIRPTGAALDDQQRHSTPAQALRSGATQLVIGRPITEAANPAAAYLAILDEMAGTQPAP